MLLSEPPHDIYQTSQTCEKVPYIAEILKCKVVNNLYSRKRRYLCACRTFLTAFQRDRSIRKR